MVLAREMEADAIAAGDAAAVDAMLGDFASVIEEAEAEASRQDAWRAWGAPWRLAMRDAGLTETQADSMLDVLAAHADVMAPLFGMEGRDWLAQRLGGIEAMTPGRFGDLRRVFLEGGSVQSWREAREAAQARKESRTESPLVQEVWGQLDRESIGRNPDFGPDVVAALEERYGRGIFARGKDATGQRAANLDKAAQSLAYRGLIPAESTADDLLRHLAFGDALNAGEQTFFQPTREDIRAGDEALKRDAAAWAGTVDSIAANGLPSSPVRMLSQTPLVLRLIGEDAVSKKIAAGGGVYAAPHVFDGTHPNMTPDMWKQLPEAMADPIAIFDTANPKHRGKGDVVFMVEIQDANGATVVVPVALDARGDNPFVRINILKSAYAKEFNGVPSNEWFKQQVKKNARYVNGQKLRRWQVSAGVQFPFTPLHNAAGNKVVTEADLVKLREANPTLYQAASGSAPFAASPDAFLAPEGSGARLAERFAALRPIEADSAHWFGEGKALPPVGVTEEMDASAKKRLRDGIQQWAKGYFSDSPTVTNADRGWTVAITPKGIKDTLHHGFDETLARSVPFIPQIVESGIYLDTLEKKPGLVSHVFANRIRLDGKEYVVGFVLREDGNGNRFYDHELTQVISPDQLKPGKRREAAAELQTDQGSPQTVDLPVNRGDVMEILRDRLGVKDGSGRVVFQETPGGKPAPGPRGSVTFGPGGSAVIRLFKGADLSSIPHEAAHVFVEDLLRVAESDGALARQRLAADMEDAGLDPADRQRLAALLDASGTEAATAFAFAALRSALGSIPRASSSVAAMARVRASLSEMAG